MRCTGVIKVLLPLLLAAVSFSMYGQFVSYGENPARLRWMQVEGDSYKVIYPQGMDSLAARYLWLLEENRAAVMAGLGGISPRKIPVLLNNRTVHSNGTVVWAPKRMELYTIPPTGNYPQTWEQQLAVHESRHVGQMAHFTRGIYRLGSVLIGQQAPSLGVGIYPSRWMLEGDAVVAETELGNTGRGRNAEFMEYYRMAALEGDKRSWEQWKHGSYRRYTPDLYAFGYLLNSTIRYRTGKYDYAGEVLDGFVKNFYTPMARDISYNASVGNIPRRFYRMGHRMMDSIWREEAAVRGEATRPEPLLQSVGKGYVEYLSPISVGKDSLLYIKCSYNNPVQLVLVCGGEEKVLRSFSAGSAGFSRHGSSIYFAGNTRNPRWDKEVYSNIFRYDFRQGDIRKLTSRGYFNSPQVSPSGDSLLVEEYLPDGGSRLCIMDPGNGEVLGSIAPPYGGQVTESTWLGGKIYALVVTGRGLGLFSIDAGGCGSWECVVAEQNASITNLHATDKALYFLSDIDGVRNVYMLYPQEGRLKRLTNSRYGAGEPHISGGELYYTSLERNGKLPVKVQLGAADGCGSAYEPFLKGGQLTSSYRYVVAEELSAQAREALGAKGLLASEEEIAERNGTSIVKYRTTEEEFAQTVEPRRYSKAGNLFRFHSWAPLYYNVERIMEMDFDNLYDVVSLGATAYSQNTLGTAVTMLGYSYRKGRHAGHAKFKYSGWYPSFQISADINDDERYNVRLHRTDSTIKQTVHAASGALVELEGIAYVPLDFSSHGWQRGVVPQIGWEFNNNGYYDSGKGKYIFSNSIMAALQAYQMREIARSGIYPKWGLGATAKWRSAIDGGENFGSQASLHLYGYIPGLARNHGIKLGLSMQRQNVSGKNYFMGNMVGMPRGFGDDFYGEEYCMATMDYAFPIYLGDFHIWKLAYFKRLKVIPFADYAVSRRHVAQGAGMQSTSLYSYGTSVLLDFAPFSVGLEISLGVRYAYNGSNRNIPIEKDSFSFLISTSLF